MNDQDREELLDASLRGDLPGEVFRARVLLDSTAAFVRARRSHMRWRFAVLGAAAVFLAGVSFLLGRYSAPVNEARRMSQPVVAEASGTVVVSDELVAWLEAARLFRQLGMEDRMARAVDRANQLLPQVVAPRSDKAGQARAPRVDEERRVGMPDVPLSIETANRILACSVGD